jgi:hypothetical protein
MKAVEAPSEHSGVSALVGQASAERKRGSSADSAHASAWATGGARSDVDRQAALPVGGSAADAMVRAARRTRRFMDGLQDTPPWTPYLGNINLEKLRLPNGA